VPTSGPKRGSCPRCKGRTIRHYVHGFADITALVDADGRLPPWIHLTGCLIEPGPPFDRACGACGLRWTSWPGAGSTLVTWRELRHLMGLTTNSQASDWLERHVLASTYIARFPALDDPEGRVVVRHGPTRRSLRFPFTYAEWQSTLIDLFEESTQRHGDGLALDTGSSSRNVADVGSGS
jgi:hypothetical protein